MGDDSLALIVRKYAWVLLFIVGLFFLYYGIDNAFIIPNLACDDPERSWEWLTCDPTVIDYIKFWFHMLGYWVLAVAAFTLLIASTGFRQGQRWAWYSLWIVPAVLIIQMIYIPFFAWLYLIFLVLALAGLLLPLRQFFPSSPKAESDH